MAVDKQKLLVYLNDSLATLAALGADNRLIEPAQQYRVMGAMSALVQTITEVVSGSLDEA